MWSVEVLREGLALTTAIPNDSEPCLGADITGPVLITSGTCGRRPHPGVKGAGSSRTAALKVALSSHDVTR